VTLALAFLFGPGSGSALGGLGHPASTSTSTSTSSRASAAEWSVSARPFGIRFLYQRHLVTAEGSGPADGPGTRLSFQVSGAVTTDAGASDHRLTNLVSHRRVRGGDSYTVATDDPGRRATVTVRRTPGGVHVAWSFAPSTGVTALFEALTAQRSEHYLGGSSAAYVDLRGHIRGWSPGKEGGSAGEYCQNLEQSASPFYLSSGGYGFYAATSEIGRFAFPGATQVTDGPTCAFTRPPRGAADPYPCPVAATAQPDRVQICVMGDHLSYDVFYGSPAQVTRDYFQRTGLPSLPPPSEFGLMKWRDVNADQAQVLSDVAEFKQRKIPIGTIWIDNPWERQPRGSTDRSNSSACTGSLAFDSTFFPDPQDMINTIRAEGVRFGLWVSPLGQTSATGGSCAGTGSDVWASHGWLIPGTDYIDFTNPAARAYYIAKLTTLFKMGVSMAKEDRGEEFRLQTATFAGGSGAGLYLQYPKLYESAVAEALRAANGDGFETLARAGAPGTAAVTHGTWGSDSAQTFAGLRAEVHYATSEPLGGANFAWGSDTGGIDPQSPANATDSPTPALFNRWSQFSAVSPVFEVGGDGLNATPWVYPAWTVRNFRASVILHYELFPYTYGLAQQAARTGVPILRAVGYQYPRDGAAAWNSDQEIMIGPDLLAAPVTADRAEADGEVGRPTPVSVYLPPGRWWDLFGGRVLQGGRTVRDDAALNEFPLYMRAGTAIGFNARTPAVWARGWTTDELSASGLAGWLYAPGAGIARRAISSGPDTLTASTTDGRVRLRVRGAPARVQIVVLSPRPPRAATVDGRPLRHRLGAAALRRARQGWILSRGRFGGVIVKLAPRHGAATVRFLLR
jgi:alpha-glucosidase (family GH31 glycosyl hydrolase)